MSLTADFSDNVFIVTEGGTKITSLMTGAVALRSDRHAITSAVAPPAERYEFTRSTMVKTHYSFYPLAAFFTSVWYWLCHVFILYRVYMHLGYLVTRI